MEANTDGIHSTEILIESTPVLASEDVGIIRDLSVCLTTPRVTISGPEWVEYVFPQTRFETLVISPPRTCQ